MGNARVTTAENKDREIQFFHALLPILVLLGLIVYGLIIRPLLPDTSTDNPKDRLPAFPLEVVFILAATFTVAELYFLGFSWREVEQSIVNKLTKALPAFFILFTIGLIIGSWMICGTIPMLVYYGLKLINPSFIYLLAFLVPAVFSLLTGTSWGSAGAVGIVIIGVADAMGANLGIAAGAVVGGAYFGDKMSPLSDTTNLAALAAEVPLFEHIRSMAYTTIPSALAAAIVFFLIGIINTPVAETTNIKLTADFLGALEGMFNFHVLLLLPPAIVLFCSLRKKPTVPTLIVATLVACLLALIYQPYSLAQVLETLKSGFNTKMAASWYTVESKEVMELLNRGGLYALIEAIVIAFTVFTFIGAMDCINAIPIVVGRLFGFAQSRRVTILSALAATAMTNSLTSNQYATSFIVGDAFGGKFDALRIPRKVLSRSLEDTGTMLESVVPWTPTAVFMVETLKVPFADYWHWQLLSLFNFIVAPTLAILGIGCFYGEVDQTESAPSDRNAPGPTSETEISDEEL